MKELTDDLQPKEREARKALAEAAAHELFGWFVGVPG